MNSTTESRVHVFVSGDVPDVHLRDNHDTARAHDLEGWVRNLDDARVVVEEGGPEGTSTASRSGERRRLPGGSLSFRAVATGFPSPSGGTRRAVTRALAPGI